MLDECDEVLASGIAQLAQRPTPLPAQRHGAYGQILEARVKSSKAFALYPGSRFTGEQRTDKASYSVSIQIKDVDLKGSRLCGYLTIRGLTEEFPELTTFFDGEIIGPRYPFLTRKWDADELVDIRHWSRFPSFQQYSEVFNTDQYVHNFENKDHIFMRWKGKYTKSIAEINSTLCVLLEQFLVPDHKVQSINGASFAGFYYICFDPTSRTIVGYYYHQNSEW